MLKNVDVEIQLDEPTNGKSIRFALSDLLARKGLKQSDCARMTGLTENTISSLCNNPRGVKLETLRILSQTLEVDVRELFLVEGV